jgi:hypothetical protein
MSTIKIRKKNKRLQSVNVESEMVEKLSACGLPVETIAEVLDVSIVQFTKAIHRNKDLTEAMSRGRQKAYAKVHEALFRNATGFVNNEIAYFRIKDKIVAQPVVKYYPPDLRSINIWRNHFRKPVKF